MTKQYEQNKALINDTFSAPLIMNLKIVLEEAFVNAPSGLDRSKIAEVLKPIEDLNNKLITDKLCPKCKAFLYLSDLPDYEYVCPFCDENFYECEV